MNYNRWKSKNRQLNSLVAGALAMLIIASVILGVYVTYHLFVILGWEWWIPAALATGELQIGGRKYALISNDKVRMWVSWGFLLVAAVIVAFYAVGYPLY